MKALNAAVWTVALLFLTVTYVAGQATEFDPTEACGPSPKAKAS